MSESNNTSNSVTGGGIGLERGPASPNPLFAFIVISATCGIAATWVPDAMLWFSFALKAFAKAGEAPSLELSRHLEVLVRYQEYGNAMLVGASLAALLHIAAMALRRFTHPSSSLSLIREALACCGTVVGGAMLATIACFVFRCQSVGSQNLVLAAGVHSGLWGGLGAMQAFEDWFRVRTTITIVIAVGMLWGLLFIFAAVIINPSAHIERLFFTDTKLVSYWAGGGCACVLCSSVFLNRHTRTSVKPTVAIGINERFEAKG